MANGSNNTSLVEVFLKAFGPENFDALLDIVKNPQSQEQLARDYLKENRQFFQRKKNDLIAQKDRALSRGKQDLNSTLERLALQEQRTGEDATKALENLARQRGFTQQDFETARNRLQEAKSRVQEDLDRTLKAEGFQEQVKRDRELSNFGQRFQGSFGSPLMRRLEEERQQLRQLGLDEVKTSASRQQQDIANRLSDLTTQRDRSLGNYDRQEELINTQQQRGLQDIGTQQQLAQRGFNRQSFDVKDLFRQNRRAQTQERKAGAAEYASSPVNRFPGLFDFSLF